MYLLLSAPAVWLVTALLQSIDRVDPKDNLTTIIVAIIPTVCFIVACLPRIRRAGLFLLCPIATLTYGMWAGMHVEFSAALGFGILAAVLLTAVSGMVSRSLASGDTPGLPPGLYEDQHLLERPPRATIIPPTREWGQRG